MEFELKILIPILVTQAAVHLPSPVLASWNAEPSPWRSIL
jgi:hypothetical protein